MTKTIKPKSRSVKKTVKGDAKAVASLAMLQTLSAAATRAELAAQLGQSYGGDRDIYTALGWPTKITFNDYMGRYTRQGMARAIIDAPVRACWRQPPVITEAEGEETEFEKRWNDLVKERRIFHYLSRVDRLASIGQYAVLLFGFQDGEDPKMPVNKAADVLYLMPYSQESASISTYIEDPVDERYGQPDLYTIKMSIGNKVGGTPKSVHSSRVIHVAQDSLENNVFGTPALQPVWNLLMGLDLVAGGCGEMFWRGAFPGMAFKLDEGATIGKQALAELQDEIEDYMHNLKRYLRLEGISVDPITPQVADPSKHVDILITQIAATKRIPKRVLVGSERGELASTQDEHNWAINVDERRRQYCEPIILRPTIDRLITVDVLPKPKNGYIVQWPDLMAPGEKEKADIAKTKTEALKAYMDALGAQDVIPIDIFLKSFLGFSQEEIDEIEEKNEEAERELAREPEEEE